MVIWVFGFPAFGLSMVGAGLMRSIGVPASATNLIQPLSAAITTRILADLGTSVVAGFGVASRIDAVVTMVVIGISASTAPLVGQNWGAAHYYGAVGVFAATALVNVLFGVLAWRWNHSVIAVMRPNTRTVRQESGSRVG